MGNEQLLYQEWTPTTVPCPSYIPSYTQTNYYPSQYQHPTIEDRLSNIERELTEIKQQLSLLCMRV